MFKLYANGKYIATCNSSLSAVQIAFELTQYYGNVTIEEQ